MVEIIAKSIWFSWSRLWSWPCAITASEISRCVFPARWTIKPQQYQHKHHQGQNCHLVVWPSLGKDSSWSGPSAASFAVAAIGIDLFWHAHNGDVMIFFIFFMMVVDMYIYKEITCELKGTFPKGLLRLFWGKPLMSSMIGASELHDYSEGDHHYHDCHGYDQELFWMILV